MAIHNLADRIQNLAQELQDIIFEKVVAITANRVTLNEAYRPPLGLQIDCKTRVKIAASYYSHTTFEYYIESSIQVADFSRVSKWLASIDPAHYKYLKHVRFDETAVAPYCLREILLICMEDLVDLATGDKEYDPLVHLIVHEESAWKHMCIEHLKILERSGMEGGGVRICWRYLDDGTFTELFWGSSEETNEVFEDAIRGL